MYITQTQRRLLVTWFPGCEKTQPSFMTSCVRSRGGVTLIHQCTTSTIPGYWMNRQTVTPVDVYDSHSPTSSEHQTVKFVLKRPYECRVLTPSLETDEVSGVFDPHGFPGFSACLSSEVSTLRRTSPCVSFSVRFGSEGLRTESRKSWWDRREPPKISVDRTDIVYPESSFTTPVHPHPVGPRRRTEETGSLRKSRIQRTLYSPCTKCSGRRSLNHRLYPESSG